MISNACVADSQATRGRITARNDFDILAPEVRRDPYPYYRELRHQAPVQYFAKYDCWAVSRYVDVAATLRRPDLYSSSNVELRIGPAFLRSDPPEHTRFRKIVSGAFAPQRVAKLEEHIRALADQFVDRMMTGRSCDIMEQFVRPLPLLVMIELLGVPPEHIDDYGRWTDAALARLHALTPQGVQQIEDTLDEFHAFFDDHVRLCRERPRHGIISELLHAESADERLSEEEVAGLAKLPLLAGTETTANLIGNAILALLRHPDQLDMVRADPSLIEPMVEEALRYDTPAQIIHRWARRDVEIAGVLIPEGGELWLLMGSANRDSEQFDDPERFSVTRAPEGHIAFGVGPHFCVGAKLSRLEARVALGTLLSRLPTFRAGQPLDSVDYIDFIELRGLARLELVVE